VVYLPYGAAHRRLWRVLAVWGSHAWEGGMDSSQNSLDCTNLGRVHGASYCTWSLLTGLLTALGAYSLGYLTHSEPLSHLQYGYEDYEEKDPPQALHANQ
jgi:hypothetical protein